MRAMLLATLLLTGPCLAGSPLPDSPHLVASGEGKVTVAPDLATITLTAQYRNPVAATAKQSVDQNPGHQNPGQVAVSKIPKGDGGGGTASN